MIDVKLLVRNLKTVVVLYKKENIKTRDFVFKKAANNVPQITPKTTKIPKDFNKLKSTTPCLLWVKTETNEVIIVIEKAVPTVKCIKYCFSIFNVSNIKNKNGTEIKPPPIPNNPAQKPTGIAAQIIRMTKKV